MDRDRLKLPGVFGPTALVPMTGSVQKVRRGLPAAGRIRSAAARFRGASTAEADAADGSGPVKAAGRLWPGCLVLFAGGMKYDFQIRPVGG